MLTFAFAGTLFKFSANTPAFESLFQLPPRIVATAATLSRTRRLAFDPAAEQPTDFVTALSQRAILRYA